MGDMIDWAISRDEEMQGWHAGSSGLISASALGETSKIFMRRAATSSGPEFARWLVLELDGVRCYVVPRDGRYHLMMTREDIYPNAALAQTAAPVA